MDIPLLRASRERVSHGRLRMLEQVLKLLDASMEVLFFAGGYPADRLILASHQQAQAVSPD